VGPRERDHEVRRQVDDVPGLVPKPPAQYDEGANDDGDEQGGPKDGIRLRSPAPAQAVTRVGLPTR